ncbi:hypothetical protein MBLNU459_g3230t1 [Dothideomycetes sp. NU459]
MDDGGWMQQAEAVCLRLCFWASEFLAAPELRRDLRRSQHQSRAATTATLHTTASMSTPCTAARQLAGLKTALRQIRADRQRQTRWYATATATTTSTTTSTLTTHPSPPPPPPPPPPPGRPTNFHPGAIMRGRNNEHGMKKIPVFPQCASAAKACKEPLAAVTAAQMAQLDPSGARARLFSKDNPDRANVGDILLVRQRSGDPFSGVCINIRRTGVDTAVLLRNQLTRVGVEMWYKIYSPNVDGIEVVQRRERRARRARLYYMRQPRHDVGSVESVVRQYQRQRAMLRSSEVKSRDANAGKKKTGKK